MSNAVRRLGLFKEKFPPFDTLDELEAAFEKSNFSSHIKRPTEDISIPLRISIECLSAFHTYVVACAFLVFQRIADAKAPANPKLQASYGLLSGIATDVGAICTLVETGFDLQAKVLLRSLREKVDFLVYVQLDRSFAVEFINCDDAEANNRFWYKYAAKGRLIDSISRRLSHFTVSGHPIFDEFWRKQRRDFERWLGQAVHPSHTAGVMSAFPSLANKTNAESDQSGLFGQPADISIGTAQATFGLSIEIMFLVKYRLSNIYEPMPCLNSELQDALNTLTSTFSKVEEFLNICLANSVMSQNIDIFRLLFFMQGYQLQPVDGTFDEKQYFLQLADTLTEILEHARKSLQLLVD